MQVKITDAPFGLIIEYDPVMRTINMTFSKPTNAREEEAMNMAAQKINQHKDTWLHMMVTPHALADIKAAIKNILYHVCMYTGVELALYDDRFHT